MLAVRILAALSLAVFAGGAASRADDPSPCAPADEFATDILDDYRWTDTTTDTASVSWRQRSSLPTVSASQITLVSDTTVCRRAVNAYNSILATQLGDTRQSISGTVIKWGNTRYAVSDTIHNAGEWTIHLVTDSSFTQVFSIERR